MTEVIQFSELNNRLLPDAPALLPSWVPNGKLVGSEYQAGNLQGDPGKSLLINVRTGKWKDFATGECGGDLISLYAAIHKLSQSDAARHLGDNSQADSFAKRPAQSAQPKYEVVTPVPPELGRPSCNHFKHGAPSKIWDYRNATGELLGMVARYDPPGGKTFAPWVAARAQDGTVKWQSQSWPEPRPFYGLRELAERPDAPVLICEGEKSADAARILCTDYVAITWPNGAQSWGKADWAALEGRDVVLWPDSDTPGIEAMQGIAERLRPICQRVRLITPEGVPPKFDAADALAAGWDSERFELWATPLLRGLNAVAGLIRGADCASGGDKCAPPAKDTGASYSWPEPTPLPDGLPPVHSFDAELLPEALRAWVMDIAHRMQCPPDFPAVAALIALSSLIGARAVIQPKVRDDWQVVPNLWGAVVGRPGVKKSPALSEALKPLNRLQAAEFELFRTAHEAWEMDCRVIAMQGDANERDAKKIASKNPARARELLAPLDTPPEPIARRYIVNDATVEKLGELMQQNEWGILAFRDELYGLLTGLDKQGQEGARAFYLQSYDGNQGYTFDRIMRGTVHIQRVCLSLLGGIQPGKIQEYVRSAMAGGSADDGLLQRFGLTVWPDANADFIHVDQWPDTPAKQAAWAVFERLAQFQPAGDTDPVVWRFSPVAQAAFVEWLVPFEIMLRGDDLHPAMVSHLAKYRKLIPALALVFALIDTPDSGNVVHERELLRALAWGGDYLPSHANRLYSAAMMPETTNAATLLSKIKGGKLADSDGVVLDSFTPRQVAVKHWAGLATPDAVRKAADVLTDYDWLRRDAGQSGSAGGRPSERYLINPVILKGGAT